MKQKPGKNRLVAASAEQHADALAERNRCNSQALRKAMRNVSSFYDEVLAPTGLRATQRSVLMSIARDGAPTVNQLAEKLVLDRTALTRTLQPLLRDELIAIAPDKNDRRIRRVTLTRKGDEKLRQTLHLWQVAQDKFERAFGKEEARALRETLTRIAALNLRAIA